MAVAVLVVVIVVFVVVVVVVVVVNCKVEEQLVVYKRQQDKSLSPSVYIFCIRWVKCFS